ncbi:MAG: GIY-YIG nuclease family protein [Patescibacteria group bacterium]
MPFYVYFMASESGTLYTGVTNDLRRRAYEHREGLTEGFTKKYGCKKLIYFEETESVQTAITREKQLKNWNRSKKEHLIMGFNPQWIDLYDRL